MDEKIKTELMVQALSEGLSRTGDERRVIRLERHPYLESTSFPAERIRAWLDDGAWLDLFFKDLNPQHLLEEARALREKGMERSQREFCMYRDILPRLALNTPFLYASRWIPSEGICWLFLEDAGPYPLRQIGDFSLWLKAARWAARLHAVQPDTDLLKEADFLPHFNAGHFEECADRINHNRRVFNEGQQEIITLALETYYGSLQTLMNLPKHLIHGEYFGKNIVIRPGQDTDAVAVTDWESAAFGPQWIDLVSLTSGRWTASQRIRMINAYIDQYERETGTLMNRDALEHEFNLVALYRALWWIGYWVEAEGSPIDGWMSELSLILTQPVQLSGMKRP